MQFLTHLQMSDKSQLAVITVEPLRNASLFIAAARGARCLIGFICVSKSLITFLTAIVAVKLSNNYFCIVDQLY